MSFQPAIVFDLFGTLVEEYDRDSIDALIRRLYDRCVADVDIAQVRPDVSFDQFRAAIGAMYEDVYRKAAATTALSPRVEPAIQAVLAGFGPTPDDPTVARFIEHYADVEELIPLPGAVDVCQTLRARGYQLGLLSNVFFPGWIYERHLAHAGFTQLIEVRAYSSDLAHMKPHRLAFEHVVEELGRAAEECVMVGDRIDLDIAGANAAGWQSVLIAPENVDVPPDATWIVGKLSEVLDLFV